MFINIVNRNYSYTPPVVLSNKSCLRIWPNQLFCRLLRVYIISLCVSVICSNNDWNCLKFLVSDCSNFQLYVSWGERRSLICVQTFVVAKQVRIADDFTRRLIENAARCGLTVHRHVPEDGNCFFFTAFRTSSCESTNPTYHHLHCVVSWCHLCDSWYV